MTHFPVLVAPQKWLDPENKEYRPGLSEYAPGGKYLHMETKEDLTEQSFEKGAVIVQHGTVTFDVHVLGEARTKADGKVIRVNLFKQSAGWSWAGGEGPDDVETLISVETGGEHFYALTVLFTNGVTLSRYPDSKSEPRLRPTTYGVIEVGQEHAQILVRGKPHPVYDVIKTIKKPEITFTV